MKNIVKGIIAVVAILIVVLGIIYMNKGTEENRENTLVVGLDDSFPPMGFRDENNEIVGFDIDLAKAVSEELGMDVKFQPISWASKEQELSSGNIDCIWNGFAYNEERAVTMTLTDPYIKGENYFILKNGTTLTSQEELEGMKIGVQSGSIQAQDLEKSEFGKSVEIIQYGENLTAFMDLETEGIDALFCSNIIGNYLITSKNKDYKTIPSENITVSSGSVIAFKQGNVELKDKIQNTLVKLNEEGKLDEISNKWFGKDMIIIKEVD
ncbi:MAG: amino acid ABC transporter substrate-binding protein [Clostridia bacterium]|nr:amino acid ABC transporter substrate-binding protein [Clostridia bacterium]